MDNRQISVAERYHNDTKHTHARVNTSHHTLDWANQPLPFKIYGTLDAISLPRTVEPTGVPALDAVAGENVGPWRGTPDVPTLARLLYLSAGITKVKRHPGGETFFRAAACTGALYHVEVYLACGDLAGLPAGIYHFAPYDFALRRLRSGDWRRVLVEATGDEPLLASAPVVLILTSTFWRNSWKYQARAYRHAFWDSGTILANLLATAGASRLPARLLLGFADRPVNQLIGVDPEREVAVALVALGQDAVPPSGFPGPLSPLEYETEPLSVSEVDYPIIREMHDASSLRTGADANVWRAEVDNLGGRRPLSDRTVPLLSGGPSERPAEVLEDVIARRGSTRNFARLPITFAQLSTALEVATGPLSADFERSDRPQLNDLYVIANAVDGLDPGAYVYDREGRALVPLRSGDLREQAGYLALMQDLAADASVNVYMLCDLAAALNRFGNRGYRAAQIEGGLLGGRLYLSAYALGLGATGLTFFDDDVTQFFSPDAEGKSVMFLSALGRAARRL